MTEEDIQVSDATDDNVEDDSRDDLQRRGNVGKCPVCGTAVDPEAFHCPTCHNYFCYHCRARLLPSDTQLQCLNQECDYYGKLVCGVCDAEHEREEEPAIYAEPEDGYWPAWLLLTLFAAGLVWYFNSYLAALATALVAFAVGGYLLQLMGLNIFGRERRVEHQRKSSFHSCVRCEQPVLERGGS